jgi:hypothetical protein
VGLPSRPRHVEDLKRIANWLATAYPSASPAMLLGNALRVAQAAYARRAEAEL